MTKNPTTAGENVLRQWTVWELERTGETVNQWSGKKKIL
jgi:hypothetical protein